MAPAQATLLRRALLEVRNEARRFASRYAAVYERQPYGTSFITCLVKGSIADAIVQAHIEECNVLGFSEWRNFAFATWSGTNGSLQHFAFNVLLPRAFGRGATIRVAAEKAVTTTLVVTPLVSMPWYYACKPVIEGYGYDPREGLQEYADMFRSFVIQSAMVWMPVHLITFSVVPPAFRVGWVAAVSLSWLSFASLMSRR